MREVRAPYAETTTIRAGEVVIARAGKAPRKFSLSRAPELAGLQASFGALLAAIARNCRSLSHRHSGYAQRWTMLLTPKDAQLAAQCATSACTGRARNYAHRNRSHPRRHPAHLAASAARAVQASSDANAVLALCRGGPL